MDLAIQTPQQGWDLDQLRALWWNADQLGYVAAFTHDHLLPLYPGERPGSRHEGLRDGDQLDGWLVATALATVTTRMQVGVLASGVTYRPATVLAKQAITLDHVSGGRAILGVGAGWHAAEHRAFGLPFPPPAQRIELLAETLAAFRALCAGGTAPVTWSGRQVQIEDAVFRPGPVSVSGIPVLVGGSSPGVLAVAARHADVVNAFASAAEWPDLHRRLNEAVRSAGREPGEVTRSGFVGADLTGDTARAAELVDRTARTRQISLRAARLRVLAGDDDQLLAVLDGYRRAGVQILVISPQPGADPDQLERLIALHRSALRRAPAAM